MGGYARSMPRTTRYDALAVRIYRVLIDPLLWTLRPKIARLCVALGARDVLDIASATGAQCRAFGRRGVRAVGVDLSTAMIETARRIGGRCVRYVQGSAYELPFPTGTFDATLLLLALHEHTEAERTTMLGEALRVLRPGGHLILVDYTEPKHARLHLAWQLIRWIEHLAGPEHRSGFNSFVARGSLDGFLARHGIEPVQRFRAHLGAIGIAVAGKDPDSKTAAVGPRSFF